MVHFKWGEWSLLSLLPKRPDFCHPLSDWPYIHISCARKYRLHPHSSQHHFLVGGWALPLWKIMEFGPVGMMTWPQFDWKVIIHSEWFQTTLTSFPFATGLPPYHIFLGNSWWSSNIQSFIQCGAPRLRSPSCCIYNSNFTMVYGTKITIVNCTGHFFKQHSVQHSHHWGIPHPVCIIEFSLEIQHLKTSMVKFPRFFRPAKKKTRFSSQGQSCVKREVISPVLVVSKKPTSCLRSLGFHVGYRMGPQFVR